MNGIITIILQTLLCAQVIWPHLVTFLPPPPPTSRWDWYVASPYNAIALSSKEVMILVKVISSRCYVHWEIVDWVSKVIRTGCASLCSMIGPGHSRHHVSQSNAKLKPMATPYIFPRFCFAPSSLYLLEVFPSLWLAIMIIMG